MCDICIEDVSSDETTRMDCGHCFCNNCKYSHYYKGWTGDQKSFTSPYASSVYLGWVMASATALIVTGVLPIVSWFATYRFSLSSAICAGIFAVFLVAFCGVSYFEVVSSRDDQHCL